jgi:hypothetical protein
MAYKFPILVFAISLAAATARAEIADPSDDRAVFRTKNGAVIVWDKRAGTLRTPYSQVARLSDCSDEFQTCLTDHRGFAFAYFRNCNDVDYKRLKFHPSIVSAVHNDFWMVFDAAPNYMFHYAIPKGVVGIYVGPTSSFDFRLLFRERNLRLDKFDAMEYRVMGSGTIAACKTGEDSGSASPESNAPVFRGTYFYNFENSYFTPDGKDEAWCINTDMSKAMLPPDSHGERWGTTHVVVRGKLGPEGRFGGLGRCKRVLEVTEILEVKDKRRRK